MKRNTLSCSDMRTDKGLAWSWAVVVSVLLASNGPAADSCVVTECTPAALATAMASCPVVRLSCSGEIAMPGCIYVTRDLTLDGSGAQVTLRRAVSDRLFHVSTNATLTLIGLTFADTVSTNLGAVIWNEGRVTARDCVFRGNAVRGHHAGNPEPTFAGIASGGVIYQSTQGVFTAISCLFSNNMAVGGNGRLTSSGGGSGWGMTGQGGAAYLDGGLGLFTNCQFVGNTAVGGIGYNLGGSGFGGAIFSGKGATSVLANCVFVGNMARSSGSTMPAPVWAEGGAVRAAGWLEARDCLFVDNGASSTNGGPAHGGAIHTEGHSIIERCLFERNEANGGDAGLSFNSPLQGGLAIGGAVCNQGTAAVSQCAFECNIARAGNGGTFYDGLERGTAGGLAAGAGCGSVGSNSVFWLTNSSFVGHVARGGDGGRGLYGSMADGGDAWGSAVYLAERGGVIGCTVAVNTNAGGRALGSELGSWGGDACGALAFYAGTNLVAFSTVASNVVAGGFGALPGRSQGADLYIFDARVELVGCILAGGMGSSNITGSHLDLGFNQCADDSLVVTTDTSRTNVNPRLGPPASNGGVGRTMALLPGSPALNAIPVGWPALPATDQRGVARPAGTGGDIGSFELGPAEPSSLLANLAGSNLVISVVGSAGYAYRLWGCSNLAEPVWSIVATNLAQSNGPALFSLPPFSPPAFFRSEQL